MFSPSENVPEPAPVGPTNSCPPASRGDKRCEVRPALSPEKYRMRTVMLALAA